MNETVAYITLKGPAAVAMAGTMQKQVRAGMRSDALWARFQKKKSYLESVLRERGCNVNLYYITWIFEQMKVLSRCSEMITAIAIAIQIIFEWFYTNQKYVVVILFNSLFLSSLSLSNLFISNSYHWIKGTKKIKRNSNRSMKNTNKAKWETIRTHNKKTVAFESRLFPYNHISENPFENDEHII